MARMINADALQELCNKRIKDTWNSKTAPVSWAEAYADFKDDINSIPAFAQPGNPLTLEQLREMDGQPVWIKSKRYGVRGDVVHIMGLEDGKRYVRFEVNPYLQENGYGKTWLAYSYPPAHIDRGEWTAEWIYPENEWNLPRCSKCGCNSKDATYGHKDRFCPKCGRAMTEEAWAELERRLQRMPLPGPPEEG